MRNLESKDFAAPNSLISTGLLAFEKKVQFVKQRVAFKAKPEYQQLVDAVMIKQAEYEALLASAQLNRRTRFAKSQLLEADLKALSKKLKSVETAYLHGGLKTKLFDLLWSLGLKRQADRVLPLYSLNYQFFEGRHLLAEFQSSTEDDAITTASHNELSASISNLTSAETNWLFESQDRVLMKAVIDFKDNPDEVARLFTRYELAKGVDARRMYRVYRKTIHPDFLFDKTNVSESETDIPRTEDRLDRFQKETETLSENQKSAQRSAWIHSRGRLISFDELDNEAFSKIVRTSKTPISEEVLKTKIDWLCSLNREQLIQLFGRFAMVQGEPFDGYLKIKIGGKGRILVKFAQRDEGEDVYIQFGEYSKVYGN